MFLWHRGGTSPIVAEATEDMVAGQIVHVAQVAGEKQASLISAATSGELDIGIAYVDITTHSRQTYSADSLASTEYDDIEDGDNLVVVQGNDIFADTDQVADGNYKFGDRLEIDFENAVLKLYDSGTVVGKVNKGAIVSSKDNRIQVLLTIGAAA